MKTKSSMKFDKKHRRQYEVTMDIFCSFQREMKLLAFTDAIITPRGQFEGDTLSYVDSWTAGFIRVYS